MNRAPRRCKESGSGRTHRHFAGAIVKVRERALGRVKALINLELTLCTRQYAPHTGKHHSKGQRACDRRLPTHACVLGDTALKLHSILSRSERKLFHRTLEPSSSSRRTLGTVWHLDVLKCHSLLAIMNVQACKVAAAARSSAPGCTRCAGHCHSDDCHGAIHS